jgi:MerR family transcriptional regulator, light-induced transcriptional regulator
LKQWITAQEAALELGLSSSTFKRFCDLNNIPFVRTPGGHRRIDRKQLSVASHILRMRSRADATHEITVDELIGLLKSADCFGLRDVLISLAGSPERMVTILEDHFVPTMWKLGDMCFAGKADIAVEKICTSTASTVLDAIAVWMPRFETNRIFVGATFPNSTDTIASKIVSVGLLSIGVKPIDLGPGISPEHIAKVAAHCGAESVWISHTHVEDQFEFLENHLRLRTLLPNETQVIIGGGGLSPSLRRQVPECKYYESVSLMLAGEASLATQSINNIDRLSRP